MDKLAEKVNALIRELLYYRYWEGYTVRELAGRLGKPVMSVYDKLKKILKKLKNEL